MNRNRSRSRDRAGRRRRGSTDSGGRRREKDAGDRRRDGDDGPRDRERRRRDGERRGGSLDERGRRDGDRRGGSLDERGRRRREADRGSPTRRRDASVDDHSRRRESDRTRPPPRAAPAAAKPDSPAAKVTPPPHPRGRWNVDRAPEYYFLSDSNSDDPTPPRSPVKTADWVPPQLPFEKRTGSLSLTDVDRAVERVDSTFLVCVAVQDSADYFFNQPLPAVAAPRSQTPDVDDDVQIQAHPSSSAAADPANEQRAITDHSVFCSVVRKASMYFAAEIALDVLAFVARFYETKLPEQTTVDHVVSKYMEKVLSHLAPAQSKGGEHTDKAGDTDAQLTAALTRIAQGKKNNSVTVSEFLKKLQQAS
ncbi:hypothetical protein DIPPA_18737 [Diplonema papillatum]|nr:hypothetical protein DIPPA_18737 [Diplonema papillatum]